jgi:tRNA A-37 threonylcarbamoyl transferase component Bud32/membrane-associated phospholipid phosphatase
VVERTRTPPRWLRHGGRGDVVTPGNGPKEVAEPTSRLADATPHVSPTVRRTRRVRRPSGAPPPLPRSLGRSGQGWIAAVIILIVWMIVSAGSPRARRHTDQVDAFLLRCLARFRTGWLLTVARGVDRAATGWTMFFVAIALMLVTAFFRRWRHLFTFLGSIVVLAVTGGALIDAYRRPRPYDVTAAGRWQGFSLPSATVAIVAFTVVGIIYMLAVPGHQRDVAKRIGFVLVAILVAARLYLGIDHPFDVLVGAALGVAIPLVGFRFFTPNDVFPLRYHQGKTAHLDVGGRRGEALRLAVEEQLGITVIDIKPIGLAGSGGSTPLRLRVAGDPDTYLFGKLYAMNHVRADRWYKTGRTILYGRLEDEAPFQSVRRLVQYEDYALRVMRDAGIPTAEPHGIVQLTPEREYLLVTEFFAGAVEIGEAEVDDQIIDEGLALVRRLWDNGLAHRDIKPANLLVTDGHLVVIDVAFAQVRPSPWREAVDLANMMLVLGVRTDADRVYQRALVHFTPDEVAEAFAAARGIASPSQLRSMMKRDGRDLVAQFRALAPERRPISLQRWGPRRVLYALGLVLVTAFALTNVYAMFTPVELPIDGEPSCGTGKVMIIMAQAVPTATVIPCLIALPAGWAVGGVRASRGDGRFWLDSDRTGRHALEVTMRSKDRCDLAGATEVTSDEPGLRRYERPTKLPPGSRSERIYVTEGACVTYRFAFDGGTNGSPIVVLDSALGFQPRGDLVREIERRSGLALCGVGAPPCTGAVG